MKTIAMVGLSCFLLAGCNAGDKPGSSYQVYLDPALSTDQMQIVLDALQEWRGRVDGFHPLTLQVSILDMTCDESCHNVITIHPRTLDAISKLDQANADSQLGLTYREWHDDWYNGAWDWSNVYIASDMDPGDWPQVTKHEIGHALGLVHTPPGTIMCGDIGCMAGDITEADVDQYNKLR